jgi:hypothetical protein
MVPMMAALRCVARTRGCVASRLPAVRGRGKLRLTYLPRARVTTDTQVHATMVASTSGVRSSLVDARRALEMLADAGQRGRTDPLFLARFTPELRTRGRAVEVARVRITDTGRMAIIGPVRFTLH